MLMLTHVERETAKSGKAEGEASIGWILGGTGFAVRNKEHLCAIWLMLFFGQVKFSSFERKLYRWGFRKLNMTPHPAVKYPEHVHFFGHESFQRNNRELLSQMKSETAAKKRRALAAEAAKQALFPHQTNSGVTEAQQLNSQVMVQDTNHGYNAWAYCNILPQHLSLSVEPGVLAGMGQADMVQHAANLTALQALLGTTPSQVGRPGPQDLSIPNPFFGRRPTQTSSVVQASEEQSSDYNQLMRHFDSTFRRR